MKKRCNLNLNFVVHGKIRLSFVLQDGGVWGDVGMAGGRGGVVPAAGHLRPASRLAGRGTPRRTRTARQRGSQWTGNNNITCKVQVRD